MQVFTEIAPIKAFLAHYKANNQTIGLVPTMGALHAGHLSLLEQSMAETALTVCSIFVNPAQFNSSSDLQQYPRTPQTDLALLEKAGCPAVFLPTENILYPRPARIRFSFGPLEEVMEGPRRPGHFSGVALVVSKLFHIVEPDVAYFGQKDWQQCQIINQLVKDLNFPLRLEFVPTLREPSGLAMSSRNTRLSAEGRLRAAELYQALLLAARQLRNGQTPSEACQQARKYLSRYPEIEVEYLSVVQQESLQALCGPEQLNQAVICLAAWLEGVRLIDNLLMKNFQN